MKPTSMPPTQGDAARDPAERALRDAARLATSPARSSLADRVVARLAHEPTPARSSGRIVVIMLGAAAVLLAAVPLSVLVGGGTPQREIVTAPRPAAPPPTAVAMTSLSLPSVAADALAQPIAEYRAPIDWLAGPVARQAAGALELIAAAGETTPPPPTPRAEM